MTEKDTTTQRDILAQLQQATGRLPETQRGIISDALRRVPERWNAAVADQSFSVRWEDALVQGILLTADQLLVDTIKMENSTDTLRIGRLRALLGSLAAREWPTKESGDLPAHDQA